MEPPWRSGDPPHCLANEVGIWLLRQGPRAIHACRSPVLQLGTLVRSTRVQVHTSPDDIKPHLNESELQILLDHGKYGCRPYLPVYKQEKCFLIVRTKVRRGVRVAEILYARNSELLVRYFEWMNYYQLPFTPSIEVQDLDKAGYIAHYDDSGKLVMVRKVKATLINGTYFPSVKYYYDKNDQIKISIYATTDQTEEQYFDKNGKLVEIKRYDKSGRLILAN